MVELILKKEVRRLGDRGQLVTVANGYARNYLIPQGLAMRATLADKRQLEEMQAAAGKEADKLRGDAETVSTSMQDVTVRIVQKTGDRGQLFGSVTNRDIAAALAEAGHEIDRHQIVLGSPLKQVGDYDVRVHLYRDVNVEVKVEVRSEGREDDLFEHVDQDIDAEAAALALLDKQSGGSPEKAKEPIVEEGAEGEEAAAGDVTTEAGEEAETADDEAVEAAADDAADAEAEDEPKADS